MTAAGIRWTPARVLFALAHPFATFRHLRAVAAPWPEVDQ